MYTQTRTTANLYQKKRASVWWFYHSRIDLGLFSLCNLF